MQPGGNQRNGPNQDSEKTSIEGNNLQPRHFQAPLPRNKTKKRKVSNLLEVS